MTEVTQHSDDGRARSGFEGFLALTEGLGARSGPEGRTWRRSELHEQGTERDRS